jgi:hypothetical protein
MDKINREKQELKEVKLEQQRQANQDFIANKMSLLTTLKSQSQPAIKNIDLLKTYKLSANILTSVSQLRENGFKTKAKFFSSQH